MLPVHVHDLSQLLLLLVLGRLQSCKPIHDLHVHEDSTASFLRPDPGDVESYPNHLGYYNLLSMTSYLGATEIKKLMFNGETRPAP